jgi:hypothetical protein
MVSQLVGVARGCQLHSHVPYSEPGFGHPDRRHATFRAEVRSIRLVVGGGPGQRGTDTSELSVITIPPRPG